MTSTGLAVSCGTNGMRCFVPAGDFEEMGRQVLRLLGDPQLYQSLSSEVHGLARRLWSGEGGADGLAMAFADH